MVASHNDLLASSVYCKNEQVTIVDWEYSGMNSRSYDLAFFSVSASLSFEQEAMLVSGYSLSDQNNTAYRVTIMKPVVDFLLLQWLMVSKQSSPQQKKERLDLLYRDLLIAEELHSSQLKALQPSIGFFKHHLDLGDRKSEENEERIRARL